MANNKIQFDKKEVLNLKKQGLSNKKISEKLNSSTNTVIRILEEFGYSKGLAPKCQKSYLTNHNFLDKIDSEEKAYFLGFMYADGCVTSGNAITIQLKESDLEHLEKVKNLISKEAKIKYVTSRYDENHSITTKVRFTVHSTQLHQRLVELGCVPRKSLILKFPTKDQVPSYLVHHFIRGYFDGDGCVYTRTPKKRNSSIIVTSLVGTLEMLMGIKEAMNLTSKAIPCKEKRTNGNTYNISFGGVNLVRNLHDYLYRDATIFLQRKYDIFNKYFKSK